MVAFNPLAGGMLTGKHLLGPGVEGSRFALQKGYEMRCYSDANRSAVARLQEIAASRGLRMA